MSFTTEGANLAWQRVKTALADANPAIVNQFRDLKSYMAQVAGNPDLKFAAIDTTTVGSDGSNADVVGSDTANKYLLAGYFKKSTGAVLGYDAIANHASAIQAQKEVLLGGTTAAVAKAVFYPGGLLFATGITYSNVTAYNGTTHSLKVNCSNGFLLMRG